MKKIRNFVKEHKYLFIIGGGVLIGLAGMGIGLNMSVKIQKEGIEEFTKAIGKLGFGDSSTIFPSLDEAIDVVKNFVDKEENVALFYENGIINVIDL